MEHLRVGASAPEQVIRVLWEALLTLNASVVVWRLPHQDRTHLLADLDETPLEGGVELHNGKRGFVIHPFHARNGERPAFLRPHIHLCFEKDGIQMDPVPSLPEGLFELVERKLKEPSVYADTGKLDSRPTGDKKRFIRLVKQALLAIRENRLEKVVAARTLGIRLPERFDALGKYAQLEETYPSAFVNLVSSPAYGTWMGASPELLVEISRDHILRTVALASTRIFPRNGDPSGVLWNQKEIEEQAMVSRYIIQQFETIRLREFLERGPAVVRIGSLAHLRTDYTIDLNEVSFPGLGSAMLDLLHPTSAVCGMPKEPSLDFIVRNEGFDRRLFGGYLGPVNIEDETHIYVNLRCLQLFVGRAVLYAGAGITHLSDPEWEWSETEWKCRIMLDVIE